MGRSLWTTLPGPLTSRFVRPIVAGSACCSTARRSPAAICPKAIWPRDTPGDDYPAAAYENESLRDRTCGPLTVPARLLRKGSNVLAIEVRASLLHPVVLKTELSRSWNSLHDHEGIWRHCFLGKFELKNSAGVVAAAASRPAGLQVWVEDMHRRVCSSDFLPPGEPGRTLRFVGAQNGIYASQIVCWQRQGYLYRGKLPPAT